jgi:hypothetical protein
MRTHGTRPLPLQGIDEVSLYGGFDAESEALVITVEAASLEAARERISSVAAQIGIKSPAEMGVQAIGEVSRIVPLFMDGYFQAINLHARRRAYRKS